ncbi:MAG: DUF4115 domain-containing protein [Desulfobacterales bacterium]|nr:DUF4115 domain-containing protein [Desulfobacterales bacterium]
MEIRCFNKDYPVSSRKVLYRMVLAVAVLAVITPAFLYVSTLPYGSRSDQAAAVETKESGKEQEMNFYPARLGDIAHAAVGKSASLKQANVAERQILSIDAFSSVTVNISVDGREYTKYRLDPNDHLELAGESRFHILISDAKGVELCFNGEPVKIKADPGQSAKLTLPQQVESR